jgi:hypothetical protein
MGTDQVIAPYHELWHVEQSSQISKTDLPARPIWHYREHMRPAATPHGSSQEPTPASLPHRSGEEPRNPTRGTNRARCAATSHREQPSEIAHKYRDLFTRVLRCRKTPGRMRRG